MRHSRCAPFALCAVAFAAFAPPAAGEGFYVGLEAGAALARTLSSTRTNVGVETNCDQHLVNEDRSMPRTYVVDPKSRERLLVPLPAADCQPRPLPRAASEFEPGAGILAGASAGYAGSGLVRFEIEYFFRRQGGDRADLVVPGDSKQREFVERSEEIGAIRTHNLFVNFYHDFRGAASQELTPWIGTGVGAARVALDYAATSIRGSADALRALGRNPNAANTTSRADDTMSDWLWGYQLMAGLDYALSARHVLTAKLRYGGFFTDFEDGGKSWKPLRGHASTVAPGGAPIHYGIEAEGFGFFAASAGIKFLF